MEFPRRVFDGEGARLGLVGTDLDRLHDVARDLSLADGRWVAAVSQIEALGTLAGYAYESPDHTFPEVVAGPPCFEASGEFAIRGIPRVGLA